MSRTTVDVYEYTHTCPGDPASHVVDTWRVVVDRVESGPCVAPVVVRCGGNRVSLPCGRVRPTVSQCQACRPVVEVRQVTRVHLGPTVVCHAPAPVGYADKPCRVCGQPLAKVLEEDGRHILCARGWTR